MNIVDTREYRVTTKHGLFRTEGRTRWTYYFFWWKWDRFSNWSSIYTYKTLDEAREGLKALELNNSVDWNPVE